ncbi:E3 ubiquitin-protein ligase ZNRF3, partial [Aspergillus udagawae]
CTPTLNAGVNPAIREVTDGNQKTRRDCRLLATVYTTCFYGTQAANPLFPAESADQSTSLERTMGLSSSDGEMNSKNHHMVIVLGIGLGVVALIIMCLLLTIFINRRERTPPKNKNRKDHSDKLRRLDAVSPIRTLEEWWSKSKGPLLPSEGADGQFICVVCLESVLRSQEIRELKCLHVFHKECLDKWYLQDHFNCPLCHRAYFVKESRPSHDFVWMV